MRSHVTGQDHGGPPNFKEMTASTIHLSQSLDLAKLNPNCLHS